MSRFENLSHSINQLKARGSRASMTVRAGGTTALAMLATSGASAAVDLTETTSTIESIVPVLILLSLVGAITAAVNKAL